MSEELTVGGYELRNCVATGATTQIWEVNEPGSPTQLAMKLLLDEVRKNSADRGILKHEFKVGKALDHPNFLQFYNIEINRDHSFFVMDFYSSPSLKTHITTNLAAIQSSFKKLSESLIQGFRYMHELGWLHRDIKPDNILVNRAGETRIIDFSLASRAKGKVAMMMAGKEKTIKGTRTYIAPETILRKPATEQTDMYSLGVTLFEVLTGVPPFAGDSPNALLKKHLGEEPTEPSAFNPNVTKEIDKIILQMLAKNPQKRFENMRELESALQNVRCFEEDPLEKKERELREAHELAAQSVDKRLDSRADAERTEKGLPAPVPVKKKKRVDPALLEEEERRRAAAEAPQHDAAPAMPAQPMPGQPMPGYMPGQPMPGMYPGMPMQPGMGYPGMPGQPMPGQLPYPGMPGQMPPGVPMPGQVMPGQMPPQQPVPVPVPQQPVPGQAVPPQPAPPVPSQQQPVPQPVQPQPVSQQPSPPPAAPQQAPPQEPDTEPQEATLDDFNIE